MKPRRPRRRARPSLPPSRTRAMASRVHRTPISKASNAPYWADEEARRIAGLFCKGTHCSNGFLCHISRNDLPPCEVDQHHRQRLCRRRWLREPTVLPSDYKGATGCYRERTCTVAALFTARPEQRSSPILKRRQTCQNSPGAGASLRGSLICWTPTIRPTPECFRHAR